MVKQDFGYSATLDRFGLFNSTTGGGIVKSYLDDLEYTAGKP